MAEEPANLVLEFLSAIRGDVADMRGTLQDQEARLDIQSV
jgi:hypothetical protein